MTVVYADVVAEWMGAMVEVAPLVMALVLVSVMRFIVGWVRDLVGGGP